MKIYRFHFENNFAERNNTKLSSKTETITTNWPQMKNIELLLQFFLFRVVFYVTCSFCQKKFNSKLYCCWTLYYYYAVAQVFIGKFTDLILALVFVLFSLFFWFNGFYTYLYIYIVLWPVSFCVTIKWTIFCLESE